MDLRVSHTHARAHAHTGHVLPTVGQVLGFTLHRGEVLQNHRLQNQRKGASETKLLMFLNEKVRVQLARVM